MTQPEISPRINSSLALIQNGASRILVENPLQISNILQTIFQLLDTPSLLECRLVNKFWYEESTKKLIGHLNSIHFLKIPTNFYKPQQGERQLLRILDNLLNSKSYYKLRNICLKNEEDIEIFSTFEKNQEIQCLKILNNPPWPSFETFLRTLPNLKLISIFQETNTSPQAEAPQFPMTSVHFLKTLIAANKTHTLDYLHVDVGPFEDNESQEQIDLLQKMIQQKLPRLRKLALNIHPNRGPSEIGHLGQIVTKILESSQSTLESLKINHTLSFLSPDLTFPLCNRLRLIYVIVESRLRHLQPTWAIFPLNLKFQEHVPNLKCLTIVISYPFSVMPITLIRPTDPWGQLLPPHLVGQGLSLRTLHVCAYLNGIEKILTLFPNLESLRLSKVTNFPSVAQAVWTTCPKVKFLKFTLGLEHSRNALSAIDMGFTGFTIETICTLYSQGELEKSPQVEGLRVNPSILNLKELKKLTIVLDGGNSNSTKNSRLISTITQKYAFDLMPQLKVKYVRLEEEGVKMENDYDWE